MQEQFQQNIQRQINKATKSMQSQVVEDDEIVDNEIIDNFKNSIFANYDTTISKNNDNYILFINKVINERDIQAIENYTKSNYTFAVSNNINKGTTKITIWDNTKEKKI